MKKKVILALSCFFLCSYAFAESCPSVHDIKQNALLGWKVFDSEEAKPVSGVREAQFKKDVEQFALAEWNDINHKKGTIHCYYLDHSGSALEAYLTKDHFTPKNTKQYWYQVSGSLQCAAGMENCEFEKMHVLKPNTQLAKR